MSTAPASLFAQSPARADSLPFRRGQWAAQFRLSSDAFGLGALRFRSASSAWVVDGGLSGGEQRSSGGFAGPTDDRSTATSASARVGLRAYQPVVPRVARYVGAGVTAGYSRNDVRRGDPLNPDFVAWQASGGVYGELGAAYFVTPQLSLGAATQVAAMLSGGEQRLRATPTSPATGAHTRGWSVGVGSVNVLGTLYF